jgi:hypothetical protein
MAEQGVKAEARRDNRHARGAGRQAGGDQAGDNAANEPIEHEIPQNQAAAQDSQRRVLSIGSDFAPPSLCDAA